MNWAVKRAKPFAKNFYCRVTSSNISISSLSLADEGRAELCDAARLRFPRRRSPVQARRARPSAARLAADRDYFTVSLSFIPFFVWLFVGQRTSYAPGLRSTWSTLV